MLDHRVLGEKLKLFHWDNAAPGIAYWHPRGQALFSAVEGYIRKEISNFGYQEVKSPLILNQELWQRSGHWDLFEDNMYVIKDENQVWALKPMNCPAHIQIFKHGVHSWRDLPIRLAEFGQVHRNEPSGALHGLMRARGFVQDDGHIFCSLDQVEQEIVDFCRLAEKVYRRFGFDRWDVGISLRPEKRKGSDEDWNLSESVLANAAKSAGFNAKSQPGEGAFYGPKLEFGLHDQVGKVWQCGVIQLDVIMPHLFGAKYRDSKDQHLAPVLLHRAILGSIERFIGILLEKHQGKLPFWLQPEQVAIIGLDERHREKALQVKKQLEEANIRVRMEIKPSWLSEKIKSFSELEIPAIIVIGDKELSSNKINVRWHGKQIVLENNFEEFFKLKNQE